MLSVCTVHAPKRFVFSWFVCVFSCVRSPTQKSRDYVLRCRKMLHPNVVMAVEFRNRSWFQGEHQRHVHTQHM